MILLSTKNELQMISELESYFQNKFSSNTIQTIQEDSELCIKFWKDYLRSKELNAFQILKDFYPRLYFPIQTGINKTEQYIDAVLKGKNSYENIEKPLLLNNLEGIKLNIHDSIAGKIPVVSINNDKDFVNFVQVILHKNNPVEVPQSMGAFLAKGINNWARIHALKQQWIQNNPFGNWNTEFSKNILPNPDLYKDKIIVLSSKPYSNISSEKLNLSEEEWKTYSYAIRLEHECTHLYTLKRYGHASNNLHDELIADYIGISKTFGSYNKEWMLLFMGLEDYPNYRQGARLQNYLGDIKLSKKHFQKLTNIMLNAIDNIAFFDKELGNINSDGDQIHRIEALCETDFLTIGSKNGFNMLMKKYDEKR